MMRVWRDQLNFASGLTVKRAWNAAQIVTSYHRARFTGVPVIQGLPISISFEPTTSCNLRCPECPSGLRSFTRATGMLGQPLFQNVIDQLAPTLSYLTFYFQGEPYLHPQFLDMVQYAASRNIYTATSTNAHYLKDENARLTVESGLDRLIISIDGTTQDTYQSYRVGGSLEKVIEGARNIIAWKKKLKSITPHVMFQFLVVKPNEHQIPEVYTLAKQIGVDQVVLKTAQIYDYANGSDLIPEQDQYSRYRKMNDGSYTIKNSLDNHCWKMWHSCVITWDGKIVPCCFDKDAHHVLGDLTENSFEEVWNGEAYNTFRASLLRSRSEIEICKNCTEGTKVWA
ncbi:SPASM domain-containing protein [Ohtaekwangia kribbensis]|jgi:radical SAM protein with 4Fe4S-binding SPASM domain|uniref:SPASM domain-containing protein n=1 Tax=Ohtaekwangia kribbensis TaxID=688913 RepID=A0ABW3K8X6_9BACT